MFCTCKVPPKKTLKNSPQTTKAQQFSPNRANQSFLSSPSSTTFPRKNFSFSHIPHTQNPLTHKEAVERFFPVAHSCAVTWCEIQYSFQLQPWAGCNCVFVLVSNPDHFPGKNLPHLLWRKKHMQMASRMLSGERKKKLFC